jgi:hypothetical protein
LRAKNVPGNGNMMFALRSASGLEPSVAVSHPEGSTIQCMESFGNCFGLFATRSVVETAALAAPHGVMSVLSLNYCRPDPEKDCDEIEEYLSLANLAFRACVNLSNSYIVHVE